MSIKIYLLLFLLGFAHTYISFSQSPTHFKIGENTFANIDIYSILQTPDNKIYVATNDGVYVKMYNDFKRIPLIKSQKGNSFFNLAINNKGEVFCNNLNGQIFKISNSQLQLYYEIPINEQVNSPKFFFDEKGNLLVFAKNFFKVNSKLEKEIILENKSEIDSSLSIFIRPMQMFDGTIICTYSCKTDQNYILYKNNILKKYSYNEIEWTKSDELNIGSLSGFIFNNKTILATEFNNFSNTYEVLTHTNSRRKTYQISSDLLLSLDDKKGINFWELKNDIVTQGKTLFPNTFISAQHYNKDGSLFLGTFGEGIIVIPNINTLEIDVANSLRGIDVNNNKTIIGSREGLLYEYTNELKKITERKLNLDEVFALKNKYSFLKEPNIVTSYGSLNKMAIVKDLFETDSGFFFSTNSGIYYASENIKNKEIKYFDNVPVDENIVKIYGDSRYSTITYIADLKNLYFSDFNKVEYLSSKNEVKEITYNEESVHCNDLAFYKKQLIIATPNNGVLFFTDNTFNYALNIENELSSNNIKKIKRVGEWLYILTEKSFQVLDLIHNKIITLSAENGVIDNLIFNFSADKNNLWLLKSNSFIKIPTNTISFNKHELNFTIDSVKINTKIIDYKTPFKLDFTQNKFSIFLNFNNVIKIRDAEFQVKIDKQEWSSYPANQNEIEIQNFDYGKHTLVVQLKYKGDLYDIKKINFSMSPPFYLRWWFYPLIILLIVVLIILFFRRKLRIQLKESRRTNELNSSKLRAIQSQMNPHFVFNALNSIQYLVMSGDKDSAYSYITRFANLVRKTLDYSDKETISIFEEIELLEVYLELEKLRFEVDFEYKFEKKNIREVQVPPMLIQPFIENALIHGLLHKEGLKKLTVFIEVFDEHILCKIEDNGIGRLEAKKIRNRQRGDHKSFALNAINNRFRILNEYSDKKLGYEYQDFDPNENEITTRVILTIPIK